MMKSVMWVGIFLILLGIVLVLIPILDQYIALADIPSWLIFVYSSGNFRFVTSPILILAFVIFLVAKILIS